MTAPVEYATASHRGEAVRSLASFLGVPEVRAAAMLADGTAAAEVRSRRRLTVPEAQRQLEHRYRSP